MNISKKATVAMISCASIVTWGVSLLTNPTLHELRKHGIYVSERPCFGGGKSLVFFVEANKTYVSMDFKTSDKTPSAFAVFDLGATVVKVKDDNQDGRLDGLVLNYSREGIDYAYDDHFINGDYTRKLKMKGGETIENMLKIDGKWLSAIHVGPKAVVLLDGKETLVDPNKSPIAILGPALTSSVGIEEKQK